MTDAVPQELADALVPVMRDLSSTSPLAPRVEPHNWAFDDSQLTAMSWWPDGSGCGISVTAGADSEEQIASLADQIQEPVVEGLPRIGLPAVWPECPEHPRTHPLKAKVVDGIACWVCPRTDSRVQQIGELRPSTKDKKAQRKARRPYQG